MRNINAIAKFVTIFKLGCSHINKNHNKCNQCLVFHVFVLKIVLNLEVFNMFTNVNALNT
jgi:hypothetical protein